MDPSVMRPRFDMIHPASHVHSGISARTVGVMSSSSLANHWRPSRMPAGVGGTVCGMRLPLIILRIRMLPEGRYSHVPLVSVGSFGLLIASPHVRVCADVRCCRDGRAGP